MGILGAKCEGCWERTENCTCGRYTKLDEWGTVRYNIASDSDNPVIQNLLEQIHELNDKINGLIQAIKDKEDYKDF